MEMRCRERDQGPLRQCMSWQLLFVGGVLCKVGGDDAVCASPETKARLRAGGMQPAGQQMSAKATGEQQLVSCSCFCRAAQYSSMPRLRAVT